MNLGTNAWHALRDRTGRIEIRLEAVTIDAHLAEADRNLVPGAYVRLTVSDTGHGMDQATRERIFEPFFTTKPVGEGTGLGLSVVHGIMQAHGGAITVASEPEVGTTFELYFPSTLGAAPPAEPPRGAIPQGRGQRILVVDDEEPLARLGKKVLEQLGYAVDAQTNPMVAFESVQTAPERYDLILADHTMPGMTGLNLARQIHQLRPGLPIVLMSGYNVGLSAEKIRAAGVGALLSKPLATEVLAASVHQLLQAGKCSP
jgi:CheY-like chemotaxis protein